MQAQLSKLELSHLSGTGLDGATGLGGDGGGFGAGHLHSQALTAASMSALQYHALRTWRSCHSLASLQRC